MKRHSPCKSLKFKFPAKIRAVRESVTEVACLHFFLFLAVYFVIPEKFILGAAACSIGPGIVLIKPATATTLIVEVNKSKQRERENTQNNVGKKALF